MSLYLSSFISICGIQLRRGGHQIGAHEKLVPLAEHRPVLEDLRQICLGISIRRPVLVSGEIGSGKTHLIRYAAQNTHHKLVCYQLSEETDAQSLIGGYVQVDFVSKLFFRKFWQFSKLEDVAKNPFVLWSLLSFSEHSKKIKKIQSISENTKKLPEDFSKSSKIKKKCS